MKFVVTKKNLEESLKIVSGSVASSSSGDIGSHFVFKSSEDSLSVFTSNGSLFSSCPVVVESLESTPGESFTVEAKRLKKWLKGSRSEVLTITVSEGSVRASAKGVRGSISFASLDASSFPWWDAEFEASQETAKVESLRLWNALARAVTIIPKEDQEKPHICSCEFVPYLDVEGNKVPDKPNRLFATDLDGFLDIYVQGMESCTARIFGSEIPKIRKFLSFFKDGYVTIREKDSFCVFFISDSGAVLGQVCSIHPVQPFIVQDPYSNANHEWSFDKESLVSVIKCLEAGGVDEGKKSDFFLRFVKRDSETIALSLKSFTGGYNSLDISAKITEGTPSLPEDGFNLRYDQLLSLIPLMPDGPVTMRIQRMNSDGYVVFQEKSDGDLYTTVLGWVFAE